MVKVDYEVCDPSLVMKCHNMGQVLHYLYPYDGEQYRRMRAVFASILQDHFSACPPETRVSMRAQHNGNGFLWGVMLVQYPFWENQWQLVAHINHSFSPFSPVKLRHRNFVRYGSLPSNEKLSGGKRVQTRSLNKIITIK